MGDAPQAPAEVGPSPAPTPPAPKQEEPQEVEQEEAQPQEVEQTPDGSQSASINNPNVVVALGLNGSEVEVVRSLSEAEVVVRQGDKEYVVGRENLS